MSQQSAPTTPSAAPGRTLAQLISQETDTWLQSNRRRAAVGAEVADVKVTAISSPPEWPGTGTVTTAVDTLPLVTVAGMPATKYPTYVRALIGYTLADLALTKPHLWKAVWSHEIALHTTVAVAARVGVWAALGRVPSASETASSRAVRWSEKVGQLVVRPAAVDDGSELWRQCLASSPGLPAGLVKVAQAVCGVGPALFLAGAAHLLQSGEVYAMRYLEAETRGKLRTSLGDNQYMAAKLDTAEVWNTAIAAAISGYSASVIRHLSTDSGFVLSSYRCIDAGAKAEKDLATRMASEPTWVWGMPPVSDYAIPLAAAGMRSQVESDDTHSVADTEAMYEAADPFDSHSSGTSTPRQELSHDTMSELRDAIRSVPPMAPAVASLARMPFDQESVRF